MIPNSTVKLCKGVPLSPDYTDTITFTTATAQATYFSGKAAYTFESLSYVRDNTVMIPNQAGLYKDCNYMMFLNEDYINKWFYAFITDVEYVADGTTRIHYVIDAVQTWFFDMTVQSCFVEREHVSDDTIGAHTLPEPVALGEYVNGGTYFRQFSMNLVLGVLADGEVITEEPSYVCNIYSGVTFLTGTQSFIESTIAAMSAAGLADNILTLYMVPSFLTGSRYLLEDAPVDTDNNFPSNTDVDGYVPKNNKLLTYPYVGAILSNNEGQTQELKYELFSGTPAFTITGTGLPGGRLIAYPSSGYAGATSTDALLQYSVALGNYPQCPFLVDAFSNWLAVQDVRWSYEKDRFYQQTAASAYKSALGNALNTYGNTGDLTSALGSAVGSMAGSVVTREFDLSQIESKISEEKEVHSINPVSGKNEIGNVSVNVANNQYGFSAIRRTIKAEYAKVIDNFFSAYGYKVNLVKVPNITGRASWNYVKTQGAIVTGTAPMAAINTYKSALNQGIRFWHGDYVGDFSRANGVV